MKHCFPIINVQHRYYNTALNTNIYALIHTHIQHQKCHHYLALIAIRNDSQASGGSTRPGKYNLASMHENPGLQVIGTTDC